MTGAPTGIVPATAPVDALSSSTAPALTLPNPSARMPVEDCAHGWAVSLPPTEGSSLPADRLSSVIVRTLLPPASTQSVPLGCGAVPVSSPAGTAIVRGGPVLPPGLSVGGFEAVDEPPDPPSRASATAATSRDNGSAPVAPFRARPACRDCTAELLLRGWREDRDRLSGLEMDNDQAVLDNRRHLGELAGRLVVDDDD